MYVLRSDMGYYDPQFYFIIHIHIIIIIIKLLRAEFKLKMANIELQILWSVADKIIEKTL